MNISITAPEIGIGNQIACRLLRQGSTNKFSCSLLKFAVQGVSNYLPEFCAPKSIKVTDIILEKVDRDFRGTITEYQRFFDDQKNLMVKLSVVNKSACYQLNNAQNLMVSLVTHDAFYGVSDHGEK
ncbi:hypothetical protein DKK70_04990 [Gilliamella apicola]|uniref:Uncharacterized protein n=1 Tax=Gilliamella apicola TaxID=1196095 RepID=A0A2V4E1Y7_9GAMM|nr:hypothetical protein [Gilliamella apicola]PXZ07212.1 hypothetical protein DKK70_04990 [Gilliamella apicola]